MQPNNFAHHWCMIMVEGLITQGVEHFFIAPGSRSTPIVSAIARNKNAKVSLGIDERSICFMALGYSKCMQKPAAVVVTSGTAVANCYPAVVEAFLSEVPLLLITADRPYELRNCGANQTIFQVNIFANHINKSFDLAPPLSVVPIHQSMALFEQAVNCTMYPKKGPVHVNVQLREPLANLVHEHESQREAPSTPAYKERVVLKPQSSKIEIRGLKDFISSTNGMVVVGELLPSLIQEKILELATLLNWPVFADITSNIRLRRHSHVMHHFDLALLSDAFVEELAVDRVIKFGARIVSKRFWAWVEKNPDIQFISLGESFERIDHTGRFEHWQIDYLACALANLIDELGPRPFLTSPVVGKLSLERISKLIDNFLEQKCNNEAYFSARLIAQISEPVNLFVSSSMPIRDLDQFAKPTDVPITIIANRGASGIDGVMSSAIGVAAAGSKPVILLIGDVAFLHDANGLMLLKQVKTPILIVVINNNGGGIFHFLPIAHEIDVVTPYLDSPHQVCIRSLCEAHDVAHQMLTEPNNYDDIIRQFFQKRTSLVLEVMIKREENVSLHKILYQAIVHHKIGNDKHQ